MENSYVDGQKLQPQKSAVSSSVEKKYVDNFDGEPPWNLQVGRLRRERRIIIVLSTP
jgi:hypothetical protein